MILNRIIPTTVTTRARSALDVSDRGVICGKIVDAPNPPIMVLAGIFAKAEIEMPDVMPCDWGTGDTVASNFNGGFYYVPLELAPPLRAGWRKWAEFLFIRPELFEHKAQCNHIDQVSFAMAVASERLPYRHLTANWNFPCHSKGTPRTFQSEQQVHVLHYHQCLDEFGLIAPIFSKTGTIDDAVECVNDTIAAHDKMMFFDMYKRHLAKEAVKAVPFVKETLFSKEFLARTWIGPKKRRLILHAGTRKTGTTSLQFHLYHNRQILAKHGVWFPEPEGDLRHPKHQYLVSLFHSENEQFIADKISSVFEKIPDDIHTVFLTTEGISNHWQDFSSAAKGFLRYLSNIFDLEIWIWFRPPHEYATSDYCQNVRNPKVANIDCYGKDISFLNMLKDSWFLRHLDYLAIVYELEELIGCNAINIFAYKCDSIGSFFSALNCEGLYEKTEQLPNASSITSNQSLREPGIAIQRVVNRYALLVGEQQRAADLALEIDRIIGDRAEKFCLNEFEQKLVNRYTAQSWRVVKEKIQNK